MSIPNFATVEQDMPVPASQDVLEPMRHTRDRWIDQAAFALYEARRAEFPERYPLAWDEAPKAVRAEFRYLAMAAYRRSLPLVGDTLTEIVAANYANLEGWIYPACDNKYAFSVPEDERETFAAQRRQNFRHKGRQLLHAIWQYLEHDTDTEAQRQIMVDRAEGQRKADVMIVSTWRSKKGIPSEPQHG